MRGIVISLLLITINIQLIGQAITIDPEVSMLALGDSYTIGESVAKEDRWPHQLVAELRKLGVDAKEPDYIATTGWTTARLLQGIRFDLDSGKEYNLVSILIGVNNQYQGINISTYEPDLLLIIDKALAIVKQDTSRVLIVSIPDYAFTPFGNRSETITEEIDAYNNIKRRVARAYGITYVDITPISRLGLSRTELVAGDGLHPSGVQYGEWVEAILPYLEIDKSLSIDNGELSPAYEKLKIIPNPAQHSFHILTAESIKSLRLWDAKGGLVTDIPVHQTSIFVDASTFKSGTYFLEGIFPDSRIMQKLILL